MDLEMEWSVDGLTASRMDKDQFSLFSFLYVPTSSPSWIRKGGGGSMQWESLGSGKLSRGRGQSPSGEWKDFCDRFHVTHASKDLSSDGEGIACVTSHKEDRLSGISGCERRKRGHMTSA